MDAQTAGHLLTGVSAAVGAFLYGISLFERRKNVPYTVFYIALYAFIVFLCAQANRAPLHDAVAFFLNVALFYVVLSVDLKKRMIHAAIVAALSACVNYLVMKGTPALQATSAYAATPPDDVLLTAISRTIWITGLYLISYAIRAGRNERTPQDATVFALLIIPVFSLFILVTLYRVVLQTRITGATLLYIHMSSALILFGNLTVMAIYGINRRRGRRDLQTKLMYQKERALSDYYRSIIHETEQQKIFLHDAKKHIRSISLLAQKEGAENVLQYAERLLQTPELREHVRVSDHTFFNAFLLIYKKRCERQNIRMSEDIRKGAVDFLEPDEITSLFGNLLDNAIEACEKSTDPFIDLMVLKQDETPFVRISLRNRCDEAPRTDATGTFLKSNKTSENGRGVGMKSVERIVKRRRGVMQFHYDAENSIFRMSLLLRCEQDDAPLTTTGQK